MILITDTTIITQNKKRQIIKNGAVLIKESKIVDFGPTKKLKKKYAKAKKRVIDGSGQVIMPGLINAHTHAAMTLLRGYADDMPLMDWLNKKIWPAEAKMKPKDIYEGAKLACQEMLASGTTTFFDMYWQPEPTIKAINEAGSRGFVGPLIIDLGSINIGPAQIEQTYNKLKSKLNSALELTIAPHSIYAVSKSTLIWCQRFAQRNKLLLHIHLAETEEEVKNCLKQHCCRPVEYLEKIGFLGDNVVAAHACWLSNKEIKILAKRGVSVAHCPASNLKLVSGIMPLGKLLKAGVNVALGTDGPSSNNNLDMFEDMKIAALIHKWNERNPAAADAQTILDIATINGAKALKMPNEIGVIDIGMEADIILVNFNQPHLTPCFNPISHFVYAARGSDVEITMVGGKIIFQKSHARITRS
ncbi:MAG TPA: N-ethylammeline chlorohydrolase [Candidatus Portnoybacteria bacterium]|nr:N-ethylammeline chlorohydrolase [Candidatus Portnoybacteria bacterium]